MSPNSQVSSRRNRARPEPFRARASPPPLPTSPGAPRARPPAFTMAEMLISLGIFSVLMLGIGAALSISLRAIDNGASPTARTAQNAARVAPMAADLAAATGFNLRAAHAVEFTVPDRTGDSSPDTIRYEWSGKPDDPIARTLNGGTPVAVTAAVGGFDLAYRSHTVTLRSTVSSSSNAPITLASFSSWNGVIATTTDFRVSAAGWAAEYVSIDPTLMPTGSNKLPITKVTLTLRGILLTTGTVTLEIHKAIGGGSFLPSSTIIGTPATVNMPSLTLVSQVVYAPVDFTFSDALLGASDSELVLLIKGSGGGCADVKYLTATTAPADSQAMQWTANSGSSWSPISGQINRNDIKYTISATSQTTTTSEVLAAKYYLDTVTIDMSPGSAGGSPVHTTVLVLNSPEVPTP